MSTASPAVALVLLAGLGTLGACASGSAPATAPAPQATGDACRTALRLLPSTVLGRSRVDSTAAGTAAWGKPAIVLVCGLPEQPPTTLPCLTVDGVDWVIDDGADPLRFTTFGRSPAVQVQVPVAVGRANASGALVDLRAVAAALPRTGRSCLSG